MSKELSPYQDLITIITACACLDIDFISSNKCVKKFENIKKALKEKENIEKTFIDLFSENGKVITSIEIKKKLKALGIIKEHIAYDEETNVMSANFQWYFSDKETQDLLKEVLK